MYCHVNVKTGTRATGQSAAAKYDYISRAGQYARARQDEVVHLESGSMPAFASSDARLYWAAADSHERSNGRLFRSLLPGGRPGGRDQRFGLTPVSYCPLDRGGARLSEWSALPRRRRWLTRRPERESPGLPSPEEVAVARGELVGAVRSAMITELEKVVPRPQPASPPAAGARTSPVASAARRDRLQVERPAEGRRQAPVRSPDTRPEPAPAASPPRRPAPRDRGQEPGR